SRPLWVEEPARRRRLPDPVRTAAVRAVLVIAVTLIQAMIAFLCTLAGSWLAFPMVISSVVSTILATWGVLDVWVTRQVWNQRHGVVSTPRSAPRTLRRERRRARREARAAERTQARTRRRGGAGQLRSEEHTSELQSRENLVCRLLLEKKNIKVKNVMALALVVGRRCEVLKASVKAI